MMENLSNNAAALETTTSAEKASSTNAFSFFFQNF